MLPKVRTRGGVEGVSGASRGLGRRDVRFSGVFGSGVLGSGVSALIQSFENNSQIETTDVFQ